MAKENLKIMKNYELNCFLMQEAIENLCKTRARLVMLYLNNVICKKTHDLLQSSLKDSVQILEKYRDKELDNYLCNEE